MKTFALSIVLFVTTTAFAAEPTAPAATAINSLGLDLLRKTARPDANALLSPYSIETALAMTYAGADGATRDEMKKVLHFSADDAEIHHSFAVLQKWLGGVVERSQKSVEQRQNHSVNPGDPITLTIANRLYAQKGYQFRSAFLELVKTNYNAPLDQVDFAGSPADAKKAINEWVKEQTKQHILNLIPDRSLSKDTRLVLANASYLKAPWEKPFGVGVTKPLPFHTASGATVDVPTMGIRESFGFMRFKGFTGVTIPYRGGELQFLILLPDAANGLPALESQVTQLAACANLPSREIVLFLPKFKIEPPMLPLAETLGALGMKTAFDAAHANFGHMAERPLFISAIFHKTFLSLDEKGTEAAAATVVAVDEGTGIPPKVIEVHVDRPFLFAIQHRASGACLFLGHVADPR